MVTVGCVLKSGGDYTVQHVSNLFDSVSRNANDFKFICLTDIPYTDFPKNIEIVELIEDWPGWWSKIELFRPGLFEAFSKIWYFDLDTIIVDDLEPLFVEPCPTTFLSDFYWPERIATGVMCWISGTLDGVYTHFKMNPARYMQAFRKGGDQAFLGSVIGMNQSRFQIRFPGQFVSYKVHCQSRVPEDTRVVCFHGRPRPWEVNLNTLLNKENRYA